jgi:hypothetical protein
MGEIAHLRPGAFQDLAVGIEEKVQLAGERGDVPGILARDPLRLAPPDRPERAAEIGERPQAEADLQQRGEA